MDKIKGFQDILTGSEAKNFRCSNFIRDYVNSLQMAYFLESSKTSTDLQWLEIESDSCYPVRFPQWIPLQNLHSLIVGGILPSRLWQRDDQVYAAS